MSQSSDLAGNLVDNTENLALSISGNSEVLFSENEYEIYDLLYDYALTSSSYINNIYFIYNGKTYSNKQVLYDVYGNDNLDNLIPEHYSSVFYWSEPYTLLISGNSIPLSICVGSLEDYGILILELKFDVYLLTPEHKGVQAHIPHLLSLLLWEFY